MNLNLGLKLDKKDTITIVLLSIAFFSIAAVNLGLTQSPTTTAQMTSGQSVYLDLGNQTNVKSMVFLLKQGAINVSISPGSPGNWQNNSINSTWPYSSSWSEDYYKWNEVTVDQTTRYFKLSFGSTGSYDSIIAEIAVIDQSNHQVIIQSIKDLGSGNPNIHNLIDEQNTVQYPSDYMQNTYFDEIYFVRTAEQYVHRSSSIYEWTHPPLGKLIQASSLVIFGFNPFGWRIMGVIFATLMIPLIYIMGKKMFGTWIGGFSAAFLLTFDFMHFTMARMGTADTYVIFFSLASQLFFFIYLKNVLDKGWKTSILPLFFAVFFFALGFSSKWLVLYGFVGELVLLLALRLSEVIKLKGNLSAKVYAFLDRPYSQIVAFLLIAVGIYLLTYIPDMFAGRSFLDVIGLQGQMFEYHYHLTATHPFSSPWYSWPFMFDPLNFAVHVPVWLETSSLPNGLRSTIVVMGNPAVWWIGFAAVVALTVNYVPKIFGKKFSLKQNLPAIFLIVVFFFQWIPYVLISRVIFIYHFYSNLPFLCLGSAFVISRYWGNKWAKVVAIAYFALTIALFILFYPVTSGVPTSPTTIDSLKWFKSWLF